MFLRSTSLIFLLFISTGLCTHTELDSYDNITDALFQGHHLSAVWNSEICGSDLPNDITRAVIAIPIKLWYYYTSSGSSAVEFRHSWIPPTNNMYEHIHITIMSDERATLSFTEFNPTGDVEIINTSNYECSLGSGLQVFDHNYGEEWESLVNYKYVMQSLYSGRHFNRVVSYAGCDGADGDIANYVVGSNDELVYIQRPDHPFEHIEFIDEEWITVEQHMDVFALTTSMYPEGRIEVLTEVWNPPSWTTETELELTCTYEQVTLTLEPLEDEVEYFTYEEIIEGLLSGHELEVVFNSKTCDGGGPETVYIENIKSWLIDVWMVDDNGTLVENGTLLRFHTQHFRNDDDPILQFEEYTLTPDGKLRGDSYNIKMEHGQITANRQWVCDIGTEARLFGFAGNTTRLTEWGTFAKAVEGGHPMTAVVNVSACDVANDAPTALFYGVSFYELFEITRGNDTVIQTESRTMMKNPYGDNPEFAMGSLPGVFSADGMTSWNAGVLVEENGQLTNLADGTVITCDFLSGGTAIFQDERSSN